MGDKDNNFKSYCDVSFIEVADEHLQPANPEQYDDIFKLSHVLHSTFANGVVDAGDAAENALDANRMCEDVRVVNYLLKGGRQCAIVVKGGCKDMFISGLIVPHPEAKYHVQWDGWSDQSKEPSTGELKLVVNGGAPLRIAFGRWRLPKMSCQYEVIWWESIKLHVFNLWRGLCG